LALGRSRVLAGEGVVLVGRGEPDVIEDRSAAVLGERELS
jgi:hypothetical protein